MLTSLGHMALVVLLITACATPEPAGHPVDEPIVPRVSGQRPASDSTTTVATISIVARHTILKVGDTLILTATPRDSLENALPFRQPRWLPADSAVVRISPTGLATAVGTGTTILTVESGGKAAYIALTVLREGPVIHVSPGSNIQALVDSAPEGAIFFLLAGVHRRQSVTPRDGMTFQGEAGTILDGELTTPFAFRADSAHNVTLRHLTIRRYMPPVQDAAVHAEGGSGWVIDSCDVRENATGGIRLGHRTKVLNSRIHDNGQIGISGAGDGILVDGNEIANNNPRAEYDMYWEAGGAKFVHTTDLVVRRNFVHHNGGPGLWTDIDNVRTLYEDNRVEDNAEAGIFHEISYAAIMRNNSVKGNGVNAVPPDALTGSGILISASSDVEVYGNTVSNNHNGITAIQAEREPGVFGQHMLRNLYVHDNDITMQDGVTGIVTRGAKRVFDSDTYTSMGNRFQANTYRLGSKPQYFQWRNRRRTASQWRAYGQDSVGRFNR